MKIKIILALLLIPFFSVAQRYQHLLIGTYTKSQNNGIFVYKFDTQSGNLSFESKTDSIKNPSYLAINNNGTKVYSVSEQGKDRNGAVNAFNFDSKTGELSFINTQSTIGGGPCYISIANDNKYVFTANYGTGSVSALPLNNDGSVAPLAQLIQHEGSSINKNRQLGPHAHSVIFSNDGKTLFNADLGLDKLFAYDYEPLLKDPLQSAAQPFIDINPGFGPRHFAFNKKGDKLYLLSEMKAAITIFDYKDKVLSKNKIVDLDQVGFTGKDGGADIHLSNDGRFLYATNRGDANEIVIFKIDDKNGSLTRIGSQSSLGKTPRNFVIDPTDSFLLVANQDSDDIYVFRRNKKTGLLTYTNKMLSIGNPVCLKMTAVK
ncbi:lactonase family protein [Pedobacter sp. SD-b]|uniref:Lactonase family protein n=1 Tax=Pedobacter segetis TaxID=2793069 RepID=A0ABS1BGN4_9SPHI|nr:lactonase family protein [Pedobacter segetis]MBK0382007.1 lactonase family protein [Pedobacter segetis]